MIGRVFDATNIAPYNRILQCMNDIANAGARIINLSIGVSVSRINQKQKTDPNLLFRVLIRSLLLTMQ